MFKDGVGLEMYLAHRETDEMLADGKHMFTGHCELLKRVQHANHDLLAHVLPDSFDV